MLTKQHDPYYDEILSSVKEERVWENNRQAGLRRYLIVFVHGLTHDMPWQVASFLHDLQNATSHDLLRTADLFPFMHGRRSSRKRESMTEACKSLSREINARWRPGRHGRLMIIAHSGGAMMARQAVVDEYERIDKGEVVEADSWVSRLDRLVLLAGSNRGFVSNPKEPSLFGKLDWINICINQFLLDYLELWRPLLDAGIKRPAVMRGSPWISDLRIKWLRMFESREDRLPPETVMLRGDVDRLVESDDDLELYQPENTIVAEVEGARHADWLHPGEILEGQPIPFEPHPAVRRFDDIGHALHWACCKSFIRPARRERFEEKHTHLVFLVHGIRDHGDWQESLAHEIKRRFRDVGIAPENLKIVNVRYGYFTALQFLMSNQRQHSVRSFTDAYIQEITLNPSINPDNIFVVAHSNGTFAFAEACRQHVEIQVGPALLAASVLPRGFFKNNGWFDQRAKDKRPQITWLKNQCFAGDWSLAVLCRGVRFLISTTGTAGYYGFHEPEQLHCINSYHAGGHQTAVAPENHRHIATFLATVDPKSDAGVIESDADSQPKASWFNVWSHCANLLVPVSYLFVLAVILFFANIGSKESLRSVFLSADLGSIWCVAGLSFAALVLLHSIRVGLTIISPYSLMKFFIGLKYLSLLVLILPLLFIALGWFEADGTVMKWPPAIEAALDSRSFAALVGGALALCMAWLLMKI